MLSLSQGGWLCLVIHIRLSARVNWTKTRNWISSRVLPPTGQSVPTQTGTTRLQTPLNLKSRLWGPLSGRDAEIRSSVADTRERVLRWSRSPVFFHQITRWISLGPFQTETLQILLHYSLFLAKRHLEKHGVAKDYKYIWIYCTQLHV